MEEGGVGGDGARDQDSLLAQCPYGWEEYFLFFFSDQSVVAGVRVEAAEDETRMPHPVLRPSLSLRERVVAAATRVRQSILSDKIISKPRRPDDHVSREMPCDIINRHM